MIIGCGLSPTPQALGPWYQGNELPSFLLPLLSIVGSWKVGKEYNGNEHLNVVGQESVVGY